MIEINEANNFPITRFMEMVDNFGHRRLEFFTYNSEIKKEKANENLSLENIKEYDIYEIFKECLSKREYSNTMNLNIEKYFKRLYETAKNNEIKDYE